MATAIVLLNVEAKETAKIAETLAALPGLLKVFVAGHYDLVASSGSQQRSTGRYCHREIRGVSGFTSQTLIAFRTYSPYDLISMFNID